MLFEGFLNGFSFAIGAVSGGVFVLFAVIGFIYLCDYVAGLFR